MRFLRVEITFKEMGGYFTDFSFPRAIALHSDLRTTFRLNSNQKSYDVLSLLGGPNPPLYLPHIWNTNNDKKNKVTDLRALLIYVDEPSGHG